MKFKIDDSRKFMVLVESTKLEFDQLESSFTKKQMNWGAIRNKNSNMPKSFKICWIDRYNRVPIGLWRELQKLCKKYKFPLEIDGTEFLFDKDFDESKFIEWANIYFEEAPYTLRDYQIEGVSRILKYKNCTEEVSMSGGKTIMAFLLFKYLFDSKQIKRMLYVVPNLDLVTQSEEKFYIYEEDCGKKPNWRSECVYGGSKKSKEEANIVFGTFQSLTKKDEDYFSKFDVVFIDETHHARAPSIKSIIVKCYNSQISVGMTGTLPPEDSMDSFTVQAYLGPCVYVYTSSELISEGYATPVNVVGIEMDYLEEKIKKQLYNLRNVSADQKDGAKLLVLEKDILRNNRKRFNFICNTISKTTKNTLVLFSDIKNSYGKSIYDWLRESTEKDIYYIDGGTKAENREYFKKQLEERENVIMVASTGTFSEGIDINNIHNIFITESNKSEYIVRQILGRGMRLMDGKDQITVIDFCDNFIYGSNQYQKKNYLMRHADERARIYKDRKFPYKRFKVKLS